MSEVYRPPGWEQVAGLFQAMDKRTLPTVGAWLAERSSRLRDGWVAGSEAAATIASNWHPDFIGNAAGVLKHAPELSDAQTTVAREHGFPTWEEAEAGGEARFDPSFERAVDAMLAGKVGELSTILTEHPRVVTARSPFGHRATLLHYIAANGVETERQVTPLNAAQMVTVLLDAGADPSAGMPVYGGEHTPLELLVTSAHPAKAGVTAEVAKLLTPS